MNKIVRSVCFFSKQPHSEITSKFNKVERTLKNAGYELQTKRLCSPISVKEIGSLDLPGTLRCIGTINKTQLESQFDEFIRSNNVSCNVELCNQEKIDSSLVDALFEIIHSNASKTFNFTYVCNNRPSSPFFPSANYLRDGFSIGLQSTDLSEDCATLDEWLLKMKKCWEEINDLFGSLPEFLGIDSSVAPLFSGKSSFISFVNRLFEGGFPSSTTTDFYLKITNFLKKNNPRPVGLCGIMFPCVEDFALAEEYEKNSFSIERNVFLSLHSGLGIDVYPIGIDQDRERVFEILSLVKGLAEKYDKPLAARFVSDGQAKIGQKANFQNQYLKNVIVHAL
jgi:hypothetical protein